MKDTSPSSTAVLIARSMMLADATPALQPLLLGNTVALTGRMLAAGPGSRMYDRAMQCSGGRNILFAIERFVHPGIILHWLARKQWLDAAAREAIAGGCRQIVVLGAGLDTLAWRLHDTCPCFEIDHPATQAIKRQITDCAPTLIAADLLTASPPDLLAQAPGYRAELPTLFIAEGLLMYLPPSRVEELFRQLARQAAPGSRFAFTYMEERTGKPLGFETGRRVINLWLHNIGEPFRWGLARAAAPDFLKRHGWGLAAMSSPEELRRRYLQPHNLASAPLAIGETIALAQRLPA